MCRKGSEFFSTKNLTVFVLKKSSNIKLDLLAEFKIANKGIRKSPFIEGKSNCPQIGINLTKREIFY